MSDTEKTPTSQPEFDPTLFPEDTCFHERRSGTDRREAGVEPNEAETAGAETGVPPLHRRKERRRRVDPTTFEKQYTAEELDFMNAMQQFKVRSGKAFPTYGEVLAVARALGYERADEAVTPEW